ncbi:MAG TPA: hypothetical protein VJT73_01100, partial [Polyangiaceae bacterium]|nr:hypothetical protein [Polyangiaceae bacterium]
MSKHLGSSLQSLFVETDEQVELEKLTLKKILAERVRREMEAQGITKSRLAVAMHTNRQQIDRLLDPNYTSITLETVARASVALKLGALWTALTPVTAKKKQAKSSA